MKRTARVAGLALFILARAAHAEPVIEPPHARSIAVPYPDGGHGDAVVVLEVVIDEKGHVESFRILAGAEPFASAAKDAVPSFAFDPATRDGVPTPARIRIEVPFAKKPDPAPPIVPIATAPDPNAKPKPNQKQKPKTDGAEVEDVHVRGVRHEIGGSMMTKDEVRQLPGAFGDAFRAIDMMPGVTPIASGIPFFFVRGAPPGNTGYFIDDVRVPLLYHLALGPSVIHPSLVDRVDFYPGGYPAKYGRFTGGIVAGETRGPSSRLGGEAEVRLYDVGVLGETPFAGGRGDALVAGRYGYPALLVPLFAPDTTLSYWDYQGRVSYRVAPRETLTAFVFGSFDELDQAAATGYDSHGNPTGYGPFRPLFRTEFHRADLRWDHAVPGGNLRTALTLGIDDSLAGGGDTQRVQAENIQLRTELEQRLTKHVQLRVGADALLYHYELSQTLSSPPGLTVPFPARNDVIFGAYADAIWQVHPRIEVVPGLRGDVFTSRSAGTVDPNSPLALLTGGPATAIPALDPRLAARVRVSRRLVWVATLGLMHQPPSFATPVPGGELGSLSNGLQSAVQASQGFEAKLPWALTLKANFFIQRFYDMTNAFATCSSLFDNLPNSGVSCLDQRTNGRSVGLEVMLERSFSKHIGGWISYTLSRSTVDVPHPRVNEASEVVSNFDRPNVLNAALSFDFGKGYHAGARFTYYTGLPFTATASGVPIPPFNSERLPDFWRIDVRLEKMWRLGKRGQIALVLEGLNVTLNKEAIAVQCVNVGQAVDKCTPQTIGPVTVPSIGVEAKY